MSRNTSVNPFKTNTYVAWREDWLGLYTEATLEPDLPIIDAHHHLWGHPRQPYMLEEFTQDISSGHNIKATIYVECRSKYHTDGPVPLRPVGEVEFVENLVAQDRGTKAARTKSCEKIIGHADLALGDDVLPVLDRLVQAGRGRLCGIRQSSAWDKDPDVISPAATKPKDLLLQNNFQKGFQHLASAGLSFDAFMYHTQIPDLTALARTFPEANIILDHLGSPIGTGSYACQRKEVFTRWKSALAELAQCQNVSVKLGGLGMQLAGFDFHHRPAPPCSRELAVAWRPYIETCIELFGCKRSMFESNFPPDKGTCSYNVLWNTFKRITHGMSGTEKADLFYGTAARVYKISL